MPLSGPERERERHTHRRFLIPIDVQMILQGVLAPKENVQNHMTPLERVDSRAPVVVLPKKHR